MQVLLYGLAGLGELEVAREISDAINEKMVDVEM